MPCSTRHERKFVRRCGRWWTNRERALVSAQRGPRSAVCVLRSACTTQSLSVLLTDGPSPCSASGHGLCTGVLSGVWTQAEKGLLGALTQPSQAQTLKREMMFRVLFYLVQRSYYGRFGSAAKPKGVKAIIGSN